MKSIKFHLIRVVNGGRVDSATSVVAFLPLSRADVPSVIEFIFIPEPGFTTFSLLTAQHKCVSASMDTDGDGDGDGGRTIENHKKNYLNCVGICSSIRLKWKEEIVSNKGRQDLQ